MLCLQVKLKATSGFAVLQDTGRAATPHAVAFELEICDDL